MSEEKTHRLHNHTRSEKIPLLDFVVDVTDNGEPGSLDTYSIRLTNGYTSRCISFYNRSVKTKREWIETTPLFRGASSLVLDEITQNLHLREVRARTMFIAEEQSTPAVSIIETGTVRISVVRGSKELIINLVGAGEVLGEINLLDGGGHSADIMAIENTRLYWISCDTLRDIMFKEPQIGMNLGKILSRRLRLATARIEALALLDVPGRVAFQILVFAREYGVPTSQGTQIPLAITQGEIAGLIGATRTRVNQAIAKMKQSGVLLEENQFYVIPNLEELNRQFVQLV